MLVMQKKSNLSDSVDYQNAGPKNEIFWVFSHTLLIDVFWRQSMLQIIAMA